MSDDGTHPGERKAAGRASDRASASSPRAERTAQDLFKAQNRKRLAWAAVAAVCGLFALILLGPSQQEVRRRFEVGARGEMRIMPELSIEKGVDRTNQLPESIRHTPPPPEVQVEPEDLDEKAKEPAPRPNESKVDVTETPDVVAEDPDLKEMDLVEMASPQQTSPCLDLVRLVRPQYPSKLSDAERRIPVVMVNVAFYVGLNGKVGATIIEKNDGGPAFSEVVIKAVEQWQFAPIDVGCLKSNGIWYRTSWRFRSPYAGVDHGDAAGSTAGAVGGSAPPVR